VKLVTVEIGGFRAFAKERSFDVDADAIVLHGPNGQGKTSFFDAILWALTGSIPRLAAGNEGLVSLYSDTGRARVTLVLRKTESEDTLRLTRIFDGTQETLRLEAPGESLRGQKAQTKLLVTLWPEALLTTDSIQALSKALTRSVYLQQDLVREFIEADKDDERFSVVSELVGSGRVTELQVQLDRDKAAWSRATNTQVKAQEALRSRVQALQERLSRLSGPAHSPEEHDLESEWRAWWEAALQLGIPERDILPTESTEAPASLNASMNELQGVRDILQRRRDRASTLGAEAKEPPAGPPLDEPSLRKQVAAIEKELEEAREALAASQKQAAEQRRLLVQQNEAEDRRRTFAQVALRHLGDRCPVCDQTYDVEETRHRLEKQAGASPPQAPPEDGIPALAQKVEELEAQAADVRAKLSQAQQFTRAYATWRDECMRLFSEESVEPKPEKLLASIETLLSSLDDRTRSIAQLLRRGEALALSLAQSTERVRRAEIEKELAQLETTLQERQAAVQHRERTGELAGRMLEALREAASEVVQERLKQIQPLLQRIYATADPHPSLRSTRFLTRITHRRGRLTTEVSDPTAEISTESPELVLSSSQMNALAVSVFLALNLGVPALPLQAAILDDPLQSLDDVNLLGLIDLLRRTKQQRQLFVSTHDSRFGQLLARKLRPIDSTQRTRFIEFSGWTRQGPTTGERDVPYEVPQLRLAV